MVDPPQVWVNASAGSPSDEGPTAGSDGSAEQRRAWQELGRTAPAQAQPLLALRATCCALKDLQKKVRQRSPRQSEPAPEFPTPETKTEHCSTHHCASFCTPSHSHPCRNQHHCTHTPPAQAQIATQQGISNTHPCRKCLLCNDSLHTLCIFPRILFHTQLCKRILHFSSSFQTHTEQPTLQTTRIHSASCCLLASPLARGKANSMPYPADTQRVYHSHSPG